jgi:hypothetical protein
VTESGVVGTAQHLVWVRDVFPQIRQQIGGVAQVFYFELFDLQPDGFRVLDISGDQVAGFHASVESAALHAYWSQRVRDAAGAGARASYRELIPDITRYFPTAEDLRLIAQTPLS